MVLLPFFIAGALGESEAKKASSALATVRRAGIVFGGFGYGCSGRGARDCLVFSIKNTTSYFNFPSL
jgi:hypothetical protein